MARKKAKDQDSLLSKIIWTRLTLEAYQRLESFIGKSDCQTVGEVARRILSKEKITTFTVDRSLDKLMEELSSIRRELNAIGTNINQITHAFHLSEGTAQKAIHAIKVADQYKIVGTKVDKLMSIISPLSSKWLQG
jgi:hypothetical protein